MDYEIVTLKEKIAVGVSARTNNASPDMGAVIGGLWNRFYKEGVYASIPSKADGKALGIYTDYAGDEKADYTAVVACETLEEPLEEKYAVCRIPAGRYAKFVIHGDMVQAVAAAWQEIWQMRNIKMTVWIMRKFISMWGLYRRRKQRRSRDVDYYAANVNTVNRRAALGAYICKNHFGARAVR